MYYVKQEMILDIYKIVINKGFEIFVCTPKPDSSRFEVTAFLTSTVTLSHLLYYINVALPKCLACGFKNTSVEKNV